MFRYTAEINIRSNDHIPINRNVTDLNQDHNNENDNVIEIVKLNSSNNELSDSDEHESALNAAWNFIDEARQNFTDIRDNQRNLNNPSSHHRKQNNEQEYHTNYNANNSANEIFWEITENWVKERNNCYATISEYLDAFESSFEIEAPSKREQNYFDNEATDYDKPTTIYAEEGPVLIYSYTNGNCLEKNENFTRSASGDSADTSESTSSTDLKEETKKHERNLHRMATSLHPIIIPRLPLNFMLPTVTELYERNMQTPKVTDLSSDENITPKRKPNNSWILTDQESSNSTTNTGDNTTNTLTHNSVVKSDRNSGKALDQLYNTNRTVLINRQNESNGYNNNIVKSKHSNFSSKNTMIVDSSQICHYSSTVFANEKTLEEEKDLNAVISDPESKIIYSNDNFQCKEQNSTSNDRDLSGISTIPTLHLSFNTEADSVNISWFKRLMKCILCCKSKGAQ